MGYDLENYESVKERKKKFYKDNPDGRIVVEVWDTNQLEYVICTATCFRNKEDQEKKLPWSTGNALEIRDTNLSTTKYGKEYASVNYSSWLENCEESAVGRCLDNAGYSGNNKCSREEMEKVERMSAKKEIPKTAEEVAGQLKEKFSVAETYIQDIENVPFDDIPPAGATEASKFSSGDAVPPEYWKDKKNPVYGGLWTEKTEKGWFFKNPGGRS